MDLGKTTLELKIQIKITIKYLINFQKRANIINNISL